MEKIIKMSGVFRRTVVKLVVIFSKKHLLWSLPRRII